MNGYIDKGMVMSLIIADEFFIQWLVPRLVCYVPLSRYVHETIIAMH